MCAVTPATVPGMERSRSPWTAAVYANSAQNLDFMKGNVHGALLDNLDSANSVEELTPTVESLPKHYAVMCAFLVVCPTNQDNFSRCRETECWLNVWLVQNCSWRVTSKVLLVRRFQLLGLFDSNVRCRRVSLDIRTCPCAQETGLPDRWRLDEPCWLHQGEAVWRWRKSAVAQITPLEEEAQSLNAPAQDLADRIASRFYARCGLRGCRYVCSFNWAPCRNGVALVDRRLVV